MRTLPLARFGLTLHPEKTRLVRFGRPPTAGKPTRAERPGTFDFLGMTHYWGRSRRGRWVVWQKTAAPRFQRALKKIAHDCRLYRHEPVPQQHRRLCQQLRGHDAYYGVTGNYRCLSTFHRAVTRTWHKWLSRRSWKSSLSWPRFQRLLWRFPLPPPRVVHSVYRRAATVPRGAV